MCVKKPIYVLVLTPLTPLPQITIHLYAQSLQILPAYQSPRRLEIGWMALLSKKIDIILLFGMTKLKLQHQQGTRDIIDWIMKQQHPSLT